MADLTSNIYAHLNSGSVIGTNQGTVHNLFPHNTNDEATNRMNKRKEFLEKISITSPELDREMILSSKGNLAPGTLSWIHDNEAFKKWLIPGSDRLWISGGPGMGKTMLAVYLSTWLEQSESDGGSCSFFFCDSQDPNRNTAENFMRTFLCSIIEARPNVFDKLYKRLSKYNSSTSRDGLWLALKLLLSDSGIGNIFCVIDGLDECDVVSVQWLVDKFDQLFSTNSTLPCHFKLLVLSRKVPGLSKYPRLDLDTLDVQIRRKDLSSYIQCIIKDIENLEGFDDRLRKSLQEQLLDRCEDSFLWLGFVVVELKRKTTCQEVMETLVDLPKGLLPLYDRMIRQIPAKYQEKSHSLLKWILLARRPMYLEELESAMHIDDAGELTKRQLLLSRITHCGSLLRRETSLPTRYDEEPLHPSREVVKLVHHSLKEYLFQSASVPGFEIKPSLAHAMMTNACINGLILSFQNHIEKGIPWDCMSVELNHRHPFMLYATTFWGDHARLSAEGFEDVLRTYADELNENSNFLQVWYHSYRYVYSTPTGDSLNPINPGVPDTYRFPVIHFAAFHGIVCWIRKLLQPSPAQVTHVEIKNTVNNLDCNNMSPLHWAACQGQIEAVKILVDHGADVTDQMMFFTVSGCHEAVVGFLLQNGGNPNAVSSMNFTALAEAAGMGYESIVKLLVDRGADVNKIDANWHTPALDLAAIGGHESVVEYLYPKTTNADKYLVDGFQSAIDAENDSFLRFILDKLPRFKQERVASVFASLYAVVQNRGDMLQLLLDHGADPNAKLYRVKDRDRINFITKSYLNFLYDEPSSSNPCPKESWPKTINLLLFAVRCELWDAVCVLLNAGASMSTNDAAFTITKASSEGDTGVIRALVRRGVNINMRLQDKCTALHVAALKGQLEMVRSLIDCNANCALKDKKGDTALDLAARGGHIDIVQALKERM